MGIVIFIVSAVIAFFVFCRTQSVMWTTVVMFVGVLIMSRSTILFVFFLTSVLICHLIDKKTKKVLP